MSEDLSAIKIDDNTDEDIVMFLRIARGHGEITSNHIEAVRSLLHPTRVTAIIVAVECNVTPLRACLDLFTQQSTTPWRAFIGICVELILWRYGWTKTTKTGMLYPKSGTQAYRGAIYEPSSKAVRLFGGQYGVTL